MQKKRDGFFSFDLKEESEDLKQPAFSSLPLTKMNGVFLSFFPTHNNQILESLGLFYFLSERETETERETDRDRDGDRETERQRDRDRPRETKRNELDLI